MNRYPTLGAVAVLGLLAAVETAMAATVDIVISPVGSVVAPGDLFDVEIRGSYLGPATLAGGALNLEFDSGVLSVMSVLVNPAVGDFVASNGTIDNAAGRVDSIAFASFFGISGSFTLATVSFQAVGAGASQLLMSDANDPVYPWTNYDFEAGTAGGPVTPQFGVASATVVPLPASAWFLATGLLGLVARHRGGRNRQTSTSI